MKKIKYILVVALSCISLQSCLVETKKNVKDTLNDGSWFVFYHSRGTSVYTPNYNGYNIDFKSHDDLTVSNSETSFNGEWKVTGDDGNTKIKLDFKNNDPFNQMNDNWDVLQLTEDRVSMRHFGSTVDDLILQRTY